MANVVRGGGGGSMNLSLAGSGSMPGWGNVNTLWTADKDYAIVICQGTLSGTGHTVADYSIANTGDGSTVLINQPSYIQHYQNEPTGQDKPVFVVLNAKAGMQFKGRQNRSGKWSVWVGEGNVEYQGE